MLYPGEKAVDPLTLDVFPSGNTSFQLYEDDGRTRAALEESAFARTDIACMAGEEALQKGGPVRLSVAASVGSFKGQASSRAYDIWIHTQKKPREVRLTQGQVATAAMDEKNSLSELDYAAKGWFWAHSEQHGGNPGNAVRVKTPSIKT